MSVKSEKVVRTLNLKEKTRLLVGKDFWHTMAYPRIDLKSITVSDGPYGIRKVDAKSDGLEHSEPATCFPVSALVASSFDQDLIAEMGAAMALEARHLGVDVILGPGFNIKRSPLCGRNFEYFSEDPVVSAKMAAAMVKAIQSRGVGATVKHFAANSQETKRMINNAVIDERTLREIYLRAFEYVIKEANPWMLMTAYNGINGEWMSENPTLVRGVLRKEWKYKGVVVTDWGALRQPVAAVRSGVDIEMPGGNTPIYEVEEAVLNFDLDQDYVDEAVARIVELEEKVRAGREQIQQPFSFDEHHQLARKIAADSMILLKNDKKVLPLKAKSKIGVIGAFAAQPRFQGAGSSQINPYKLSNLLEGLNEVGCNYTYSEGFSLTDDQISTELVFEAIAIAKESDVVVMMAGLPATYEVEGADRRSLALPNNQNALIEEIVKVNANVIVVINAGGPVTMPWLDKVNGVIMSYLGGSASGLALADVLSGRVNPSGKLAETFPMRLSDTPTATNFATTSQNIDYRESIFVGYRYYQSFDIPVQFPFGFGLSYTKFKLSDISVNQSEFNGKGRLKVNVKIKNTGAITGKEVVQVYVGQDRPVIFKAKKELRDFNKVELKPGEEKTLTFTIDKDDFVYWNVNTHDWEIEAGNYKIYVGTSSEDIDATLKIKVAPEDEIASIDYRKTAPSYYGNLTRDEGSFQIPYREFKAIYGSDIYHVYNRTHRPFTMESTLNDTAHYKMGRMMINAIKKQAIKQANGNKVLEVAYINSVLDLPFRAIANFSNGSVTYRMVQGMIDIVNLKLAKGIWRLLTPNKKFKYKKRKSKVK